MDQGHTTHVNWVRAALRDALGVDDDGGTVTLTSDDLDELARVAAKATINWVVGAAKNEHIDSVDSRDY